MCFELCKWKDCLVYQTTYQLTDLQDGDIVREDKQTEIVRVINSYDTEGNGFISTDHLTDLMSALNLVSEPEEQ